MRRLSGRRSILSLALGLAPGDLFAHIDANVETFPAAAIAGAKFLAAI